jgi:cystathionine gamma-synthase/methionine-gamma-lyase
MVKETMNNHHQNHFDTQAVHAGERIPLGAGMPVSSPITPSVGYTYEDMHEADAILGSQKTGYVYSRYSTPSVHAFELAVATLEGGAGAQAYASGMAALHGALLGAGLVAGDRILAALDLYGATYSLLGTLLKGLGIEPTFIDTLNLQAVRDTLERIKPKVLLVETISNPLLKIANLPELAGLAHANNAMMVVDNTFATPYLCQPLKLGADLVVHSATKYISGHGDVLAGVVICDEEEFRKRLYENNKLIGAVLGPFEAWLALRGLKTLPLRLQRQCDNALQIAHALTDVRGIENVRYPGLESHPHHLLAQELFNSRGYGGVISFEIAGAGKTDVFRFMEALRLVQPATTLGDIYTLMLHPATSSHRSLSEFERKTAGIPENLVRLSCGIEAVEDILADLRQALDYVRTPRKRSR